MAHNQMGEGWLTIRWGRGGSQSDGGGKGKQSMAGLWQGGAANRAELRIMAPQSGWPLARPRWSRSPEGEGGGG